MGTCPRPLSCVGSYELPAASLCRSPAERRCSCLQRNRLVIPENRIGFFPHLLNFSTFVVLFPGVTSQINTLHPHPHLSICFHRIPIKNTPISYYWTIRFISISHYQKKNCNGTSQGMQILKTKLLFRKVFQFIVLVSLYIADPWALTSLNIFQTWIKKNMSSFNL